MASKKSRNTAYLTKRRLLSAARRGIRKAAEETMERLGYTVIAKDGWVVKKYKDGTIQRISRIPSAGKIDLLVD